jgi:ATP-dependent exoDNAse (exonuclease V) alpha subunit
MAIRGGDPMAALTMLPQVKAKDFVEAGAKIQSRGGVVICYRNDTRHWANQGIRELRRLPPADILGDEPVLVLKNNYRLNVFNGETHRFSSWFERPMGRHHVYDRWKKLREETTLGIGIFRTDEGQEFTGVVLFEELFGRLKVGFSAMDNTADIVHHGQPIVHANFGYTMTAHKAQGSEWNDVLVAWEPSLRFWGDFRDSSLRWLYTAVTRARERCSICFGVSGPRSPT